MIAVTLLCQRLQLVLLVITHTITQYGQVNTRLTLLLNQRLESVDRGNTHIEITIGAEDHPVISAFHKVLLRNLIGQLNAGTSGSGASGLQVIHCFHDLLSVGTAC